MQDLTYQQHLKWYVDDTLFDTRVDDSQSFRVEIGKVSRPPNRWSYELDFALRQLLDTHGSRLAVFYSGGSDSEIVVRELHRLGASLEVHLIKFTHDKNAHETQHADAVCAELGITPIVHVHDVETYLQEEKFLELAVKYQCSQLAYLTVIDYVRKVDLPAIMGGEVYLQKHQIESDFVHSNSEWYYIYRENEDGCTYRYTKDTGHTLINEVFTYTPELLYSWLTHPKIVSVANNEVKGKITLLSVKREVYEEQLGYKLTAQSKFHGYEALGWTNLKARRLVEARIPKGRVGKLEYHSLLRKMEG